MTYFQGGTPFYGGPRNSNVNARIQEKLCRAVEEFATIANSGPIPAPENKSHGDSKTSDTSVRQADPDATARKGFANVPDQPMSKPGYLLEVHSPFQRTIPDCTSEAHRVHFSFDRRQWYRSLGLTRDRGILWLMFIIAMPTNIDFNVMHVLSIASQPTSPYHTYILHVIEHPKLAYCLTLSFITHVYVIIVNVICSHVVIKCHVCNLCSLK